MAASDVDGARSARFTAAEFLEAGRDELRLELVVGGDALGREIEEPGVSRPGLALTGFYSDFAWRRLQLIGNAESAYLASLDGATRLARLTALVDRGAFCFVYTNGRRPSPDEAAQAAASGAVILASPLQTCVFSHRCAFVIERLSVPHTQIYGTMVEVAGLGVLFEGEPGLGKSECALGLIKRGCALIADDLTCIRKEVGNDTLFGSASELSAGYMEIRGIGFIDVAGIFGISAVRGEKRLQLVITFRRLEDVRDDIDRLGQERRVRTILGVDVPNIIIPVSEGRDLVNLVETAALQQRYLMTGRDPVKDLEARFKRRTDERNRLREQRRTPTRPAEGN